MRFELSIALRHLASRKIRSGLISIITFISITGVVVGVTALIAVIAVMDGAQEDYMHRLIEQYAHIEIWPAAGFDENGKPKERVLYDYQELLDIVRADPDVVAASPVFQGYVMLEYQPSKVAKPVLLLGIDPVEEDNVFSREGKNGVEEMKKYFGKREPGHREIILGNMVSEQKFGIPAAWYKYQDSQLEMIATCPSASADTMTVRGLPRAIPLKVVGAFKTGILQIDQEVALVSLETGRGLFMPKDETGNAVHFIHMRLKDADRAEEARQRLEDALEKAFPDRCSLHTWKERNPELFYALKLEKLAMFIILLLVIVVAGLNIIGTLILITMEKTREIGILRAMGCARRTITRVFILEGVIIGVVGTALGILFGLALCWYLKYHCPVNIPEAVYGLDGLPVLVKPMTVLIISAASIGISTLAAFIPAMLAARLNVVEALRYD